MIAGDWRMCRLAGMQPISAEPHVCVRIAKGCSLALSAGRHFCAGALKPMILPPGTEGQSMTQTPPLLPAMPIIPRPYLYRLSGQLVRMLQSLEIGPQGYDLLHSLFHAMCRRVPNWHNGTAWQPDEGYQARCLDLRIHMGRGADNGNRSITRAIEQLAPFRMFERLELRHKNTWLRWRLRDEIFDILFDPLPAPYGLYDIRACKNLGSELEHILYAHIGLVRRMKKPEFPLELAACAEILGPTRTRGWSGMRRPVLKAAKGAAQASKLDIMVVAECHGFWPGIDRLRVRPFGEPTGWSYKNLVKMPPEARKILILKGKRWIEVAPADLCGAISVNMEIL